MGNENSRSLNPTELSDLTDRTMFSQHEIREWYKKFHADCPSGQMNKEEFRSLFHQLFPGGDATNFANHVFHIYDKDRNGYIDFKEFLCTVSIASRGTIDEKLKWAFSVYDLDGNGYVTKKEVLDIVQAIFRMRGEQNVEPERIVSHLFAKLDKDGDQRLSDVEFILGAKSAPELLCILESERTVK